MINPQERGMYRSVLDGPKECLEQQVYGWLERLSQAAGCTTKLKDKCFICFMCYIYELNGYAFTLCLIRIYMLLC
jgi:hypothetical protein